MKRIVIALVSLMLCGYGSASATDACQGTVDVPAEFAGKFKPAVDEALLNPAIGEPNTGSLCQGKVYVVSGDDVGVTIYRAWNSTNPGSRLGKWWAFYRPNGE